MITMAKPEPISDRVRNKLDRLHGARRSRRTVSAVVWALALLVACAAIAMSLDAALGWWSKGVRLLISAAVFGTVFAAVAVGLRRIFAPRRELELARVADEKTPALQERMQTVLSASHWSDPPSHLPSGFPVDVAHRFQHDPIMRQLVAVETNDLVDNLSPREAAKEGSLTAPLIVGAAGVLGCLAIAIWVGSDIWTLATRLVVPTSDITRHHLDGVPGDQVLPKGETWELRLAATGPTASIVHFERELQREKEASAGVETNGDLDQKVTVHESVKLTPKRGSDNEFLYRQRRLANSFRYRLSVGDLRTPWHRVIVAERPRITNATMRVTPPTYTALKPKFYRRMPNRVTVIEGSTIELCVTGAGVVDQGMLLIDGQPSRTMWSDDGSVFKVSLDVSEETIVSPQLLEPNGLSNLRSPKCRILTRLDLPPTVRIKTPRPDQKVRPDDKVTLTFQAKDDVGLAKARLVVESESKDGVPKTLDVIDLPVPMHKGEPIKDWKGKTQLDLSKYQLSEGQSLRYRIEAYDTKQASILAESKSANEADDNSTEQGSIEKHSTKSDGDSQQSTKNGKANSLDSSMQQSGSKPLASTDNTNKEAGETVPRPSSKVGSQSQEESEKASEKGTPNASQSEPTNSGQPNSKRDAKSKQGGLAKDKKNAASAKAGNSDTQTSGNPSMQDAATESVTPDKPVSKADGDASKSPTQSTDEVSQELADSEDKSSTDSMTESEDRSADKSAPDSKGENNAEPNDRQATRSSSSGRAQPSKPRTSSKQSTGAKLTAPQAPSEDGPPPEDPANKKTSSDDKMRRRGLDIPRPSSSQQMRLEITETIGSYEGDARRKTEVAVAGTIHRMEKELESAREQLSGVLESQSLGEPWNADLQIAVGEANKHQLAAIDAVKALMKRTKNTPYAFIGVQLAEITHTHILPAAQDAESISDSTGDTRLALLMASRQQTVRAIERLKELHQTFEQAKRDFELAKDVQQIAKMYRVYLEDSLAELSKVQKGDPDGLKRTMAELDFDEEYLTRLREVLEMQNELRAELARILASDPRLMKRYFQNFGERGKSIRLQLFEVAKRQRMLHDRLGLYAKAVDQDKAAVDSLVKRHASLMTSESLDLVQRAFEIEETFETWLPLQKNDSAMVSATRNAFLEFSAVAAGISARYETGLGGKVFHGNANLEETKSNLRDVSGSVVQFINAVDRVAAQLDQLSQADQRYAGNALRRVFELGELRDQAARWNQKAAFLAESKFAPAIGVEQLLIAMETHALTEKLTGLQAELAGQIGGEQNALPRSIALECDALLAKLDRDIEPIQLASIRSLQKSLTDKALVRTQVASDGLDEACELLDKLLKNVIRRLDELPPDPLADLLDDPTLDQILAILEQERQLAELLGIPARPTNLQIINDWATGSKGGSGGAGRARLMAMIQAAMKQQGKNTDSKLKKLRQKLLKEKTKPSLTDVEFQRGRGNAFGWNIVRSQLGAGLLQGSDGLPPEAYRRSINRYFELISGAVSATTAASDEE